MTFNQYVNRIESCKYFCFRHIWLNALMHRASNSTAPQLQLFLMPPQGELWAEEEEERKEAIDRGKGKGEETGDGRTIE